MPNTSATGGYLVPDPGGPAPLQGEALEDFLQEWIVGITGIEGAFVRPRWQPEPPNMPPRGTTWCGFGVTTRPADWSAHVAHELGDDEQGQDRLTRQETLELVLSFYGPASDSFAAILRDGCAIGQNLEPLFLQGFGFQEIQEPILAPVLFKEIWQDRLDVTIILRRQVQRVYPIRNVESAVGTLTVENPADHIVIVEDINVEPLA